MRIFVKADEWMLAKTKLSRRSLQALLFGTLVAVYTLIMTEPWLVPVGFLGGAAAGWLGAFIHESDRDRTPMAVKLALLALPVAVFFLIGVV